MSMHESTLLDPCRFPVSIAEPDHQRSAARPQNVAVAILRLNFIPSIGGVMLVGRSSTRKAAFSLRRRVWLHSGKFSDWSRQRSLPDK